MSWTPRWFCFPRRRSEAPRHPGHVEEEGGHRVLHHSEGLARQNSKPKGPKKRNSKEPPHQNWGARGFLGSFETFFWRPPYLHGDTRRGRANSKSSRATFDRISR